MNWYVSTKLISYKLSFYVVFREHPDRFSDDGYEEPPVPIPNTVVKLVNAESTWLETAWEDRKSLINKRRAPKRVLFFYYLVSLHTSRSTWDPQ